MSNWHDQITQLIPDFDLGRCHWLRCLVKEGDRPVACLRMVLGYAGQYDITLVAKGVREMPLLRPATTLGVAPYLPYDLGELQIFDNETSVVLSDELKGWRIVADSLSFESISPSAADAE